jgi:hypothetical protein
VTKNGGDAPLGSPDGESIYYTKVNGSLWRMPVSGGEENQVLPFVAWRAFSVVKDGIYFIPGSGADGKCSIHFLNFSTAKVKAIAPISTWPTEGLSASPDGRFLLFSQFDEIGSDLMLVENFQ